VRVVVSCSFVDLEIDSEIIGFIVDFGVVGSVEKPSISFIYGFIDDLFGNFLAVVIARILAFGFQVNVQAKIRQSRERKDGVHLERLGSGIPFEIAEVRLIDIFVTSSIHVEK
jgi:hypothetical protein